MPDDLRQGRGRGGSLRSPAAAAAGFANRSASRSSSASDSRAAFENVVEQLRSQGVTMLRRGDHHILEAFERVINGAQALANAITGWENHWAIRNLVTQRPEGVSARTKAVLTAAEQMTPDDYRARLMQREEARRRHDALAPLVDALIAPASPGPAPVWTGETPGQPPAARPTGDSVFNSPSSVLGAPAITVPLTAVHGLPMGIQLVGQPHTGAGVTANARWMMETIEAVVIY